MNKKSYVILYSRAADTDYPRAYEHPYTHRIDAENKAYKLAQVNPQITYYIAEIQTKYKATDVVVTELT